MLHQREVQVQSSFFTWIFILSLCLAPVETPATFLTGGLVVSLLGWRYYVLWHLNYYSGSLGLVDFVSYFHKNFDCTFSSRISSWACMHSLVISRSKVMLGFTSLWFLKTRHNWRDEYMGGKLEEYKKSQWFIVSFSRCTHIRENSQL